MPKLSRFQGLEKTGEQARHLADHFARGQAKALDEYEQQQERMAGIMRWQAEKDGVPFEMRDALLDINRNLGEMRAENAEGEASARRRDRRQVLMNAAVLVLAAVALAVAVADLFW